MHRRLAFSLCLAALGSLTVPAYAQEPDLGAPAHVALVEGAASLERDGRTEASALNMPLLTGDRLRTADGRVEVLFEDGSTLHLDSATTIDVQSDDLLRLIDGRVRLNLVGRRPVDYRIDSPAGAARITQAGEYRVALIHGARETQLELAVLRGAGELFTDEGSTALRAGERAYASAGLAPSYPYTFNSANWDDFDRWSEQRRDIRLGVSTTYLPSTMQAYAPTFDQYGDWRYAQPYGYVWYPRVDTGWRPYYYGRWMTYPRYGWTWIGLDAFSWPTHHYGRWGFSAGSWFWIPAARWAPAYVSWAYAPGYVSWCPLGFDDRPIIQINVNSGRRYYSPWDAWTVVNAGQFGGAFVHQRAVSIDRVDVRHRPAFVSRPAAPAYRDIAVPRGSAPIRWAGGQANDANYFTRGGDRGEHIAAPVPGAATRSALPAPSRQPRDLRTAPGPRIYDASREADVAQPRAIPRGAPPAGSASSAGSVGPRTTPEGHVRRIDPRVTDNPAYTPRSSDDIGRAVERGARQPIGPAAPDPRVAAPYSRRPIAPEPGGRTVPPQQSAPVRPDRGEMAVPRGTPAQPRGESPFPSYERPAYGGDRGGPSRVAPPPSQPSAAPAPAPAPPRAAPAERPASGAEGAPPRAEGRSRPSGGPSSGQAVPRRGGGRGGA